MARLILLRHGRSLGNANREIIQGSGPEPENTLDEVGERQAKRLGYELVCRRIQPDGVWASPLTRARQTCDIALGVMGLADMPVQEDDRLREMCKGLANLPGGMEGRRREDVETPEYWAAYKQHGWKHRHGSLESGGQTAEEVGLQTLSAMNDIADRLGDGALGLVFMHAQSIRFGVGAALDWPDIQYVNKEYLLGNCEGIDITRDTNRLWQVTGRIVCEPDA